MTEKKTYGANVDLAVWVEVQARDQDEADELVQELLNRELGELVNDLERETEKIYFDTAAVRVVDVEEQ